MKDCKDGKHQAGNGGYSIVELIIVIAIIAVIVATATYSVKMIFSSNAKACANDLQRAIADCKVTTMGKAGTETFLEISGEDSGIYSQMTIDGVAQEQQKIGSNRVTVLCKKGSLADDGAGSVDITNGGKVKIAYDRSTGSFTKATTDSFDTIVIKGGSKEYELKLIGLTGKTELKLR